MAAKKPLPDRVQLKGLDSLFGIDQEQTGQVLDVPIRELFPFQNHPFKVLDDEKMAQTVESVRENGILVPIMVRNRPEGGYEVISGHRRKHAAEIVGLETVPVIIRDLTDDEAVIAMVDANIQREEILPSEKAFAYKMKLDALKHKAGRPSKENLRQVGENYRSYDLAAENSNDSARTIQRYIRLTELLPDLLELVDSKKIKFNPAVELSYITPNEQFLLLEVMKEDDVVPSLSQAQQIKKLSQEKRCTKEALHALLAVASIKERNVVIKHEVIMQYFPAEASDAEIESLIVRLLADYRKTHGGV
ncbi:ParB/RepB/Spo0J family partition protein [Lachnoclostridium sp. Marseille-P6806]|uniref:ParB/RepB/Spo0J family partition protein n=1 Tax=Lachnoclostridium sp. Marseille-P6806 TaxID=2364793 RepID=UPI0010302306|nr:ParB/RepB/Spo0J family partition protein [Lachnoclostridium sp. Marseille-P6806]